MLRFLVPFVSLLYFLLSGQPVPTKNGGGCDPNGLCKPLLSPPSVVTKGGGGCDPNGLCKDEAGAPLETQVEGGGGCDPDGVK